MVAQWRRSGKSQAAFCREEGVKPHVLTYWKSKLEGRESAPTNAFVEVMMPREHDEERSVVEVTLPTGAVLRCYGKLEVETVKQLCAVLGG